MSTQRRGCWCLIALGTSLMALLLTNSVGLAQTNVDEAVKAVVRVIPQRCSPAGCREMDLGSGAIIHPSGIILTAWHVTVDDPGNLAEPDYADDFVIEVVEGVRDTPSPRFRAELIAVKPAMDLALLRIYQDKSNGQTIAPGDLKGLPTLTLSNRVATSGQVRIMGYPPAGGQSVSYPLSNISGFDENGALIKVQDTLSEGFSGGPALLEQDGLLKIVGVVVRRRGNLGEVGLIRNIDQLKQLLWFSDASRVWAENVRVDLQESGADSLLHISVDVNALDFVESRGRLLAYGFDATTQQPWRPPQDNPNRTQNGQLVLSQTFESESFVDTVNQVTIIHSQQDLSVGIEQLIFKIVLWNVDTARVLWWQKGWGQAQEMDQNVVQQPASTRELSGTPATVITAISIPTATATSITAKLAQATEVVTADPPTVTSTPVGIPTNTLVSIPADTRVVASFTPLPTTTPTITPLPPTSIPTITPLPPTPIPTVTPLPPTPIPTVTPLPPTPIPTVTPLPPTPTPIPQLQAASCPIPVNGSMISYWDSSLGCPTAAMNTIWASYTRYERGMMMWRSDTKLIYGFFNGSNWQQVQDLFHGGLPDMPTPGRGHPPSGGLFHPIRGTGLVWATNDVFYNNLGWATMEQRGFCASHQLFANGFILFENGLPSCSNAEGNTLPSAASKSDFDLRFVSANYSGAWRRN